ncbi:CHRD domain-containing protein [Halioxenophilus aromaticivorans]|uniref:CHRD domain-containing protein n=1 Tax=Halioxenophilus aromaticivorans TaxID=1306992 RepID=A0AAV3U4S7_9ALTE
MFSNQKTVLTFTASALLITGCGGSDNNRSSTPVATPEPDPVVDTYTVQLKGEQEVPMVESDNQAMATVTITDGETLSAMLDLSSVAGVTGAHIHAGEVGINGDVVFAFSDDDMDGSWEIQDEMVSDDQLAMLLAGGLYINVHTSAQASGELRGQILVESQSVHVFMLKGEQEVPSVYTSAYGHGYVFYDSATGAMETNVWTWDVQGEAAHVHAGQAGLSGGVVLALEMGEGEGMWQSPDGSMLTGDEASQLMAAELYVNVHSSEHAGGEIRGQILPEDYQLMVFPLSGMQEVPQVDTEATGLGYATLNSSSGELKLNAHVFDMTATAAHVHQGEIAMSGDVAIMLEANSEMDGLWQTPAGTMLEASTQAALLAGGHYVNVHSDDFPGGELRGQIVASPWQVLAFDLSGAQEVPSVMSSAGGDGYGLVNSKSGELLLRVITENMTATAAHLHAGTAGANGGVAVGLNQSTDNMAMWMTPDSTVLGAEDLAEFLDAGHYVNVHSAEFASGEIRGQALTANTHLLPLAFSGDNSVPPVDTMASGEGAFTINTSTGSLRGAFSVSNMVSTAAHIHQGAVGQTGDVVVMLEATDTGYKVPDAQLLTADQTNTLIGGGHYVNVHSDAHPSGEIRAQIQPE